MNSLSLILGLSCITLIAKYCDAKGNIMVKLEFFKNPDGKDKEGKCCDKNLGLFCKADGCDHMFNLCVDRKDAYGCTLGRIQTPAVKDQNVIEFTDAIGNMKNPLVFPVNGPIPAAVDIKVAVYDEDTGFNAQNAYVDLIKVPVRNLSDKPQGVTATHRTTIDVSVWYECLEGFCGAGCKDKTSRRELWLRELLDKYYD